MAAPSASHPDLFPTFVQKDEEFYNKLQAAHDNCVDSCRPFLSSYLDNMLSFGKQYELDVSKVRRRIRMIGGKV
jgi:hypothetical protein